MGASLVSGGPVSLLYGFMLAVVGNLATAISLGEAASMFPGAGGQYQFIGEMSSPKYKAFLSFFSGWITLLGWVALTASAPYAAGNLIQGLASLSNPDLAPERYRTTLIYIGILLLSFCFNQWGSRILPLLENLIMTLHILFFFMILIAVCIIPPKRHSAAFVFSEFQNNSGWENNGVAWCLGMLTSAYILVGYDSATHISEELKNPRTGVPRAMVGSILINGTMGFALLIAILFGMPSIQDALSSSTGFPIIQIFYYMTRENAAAASAMTSTIIISASLATVGLTAATSRTLWAFARDRGPPFHHWLSQLNAKSRVPTNALILITVVLALLGLLNIASTAAFGAILSLTVVALNLSYLFPVVAILYRRLRTPEMLTWGPWKLSHASGIICNIISICWIIFVTAFLLLPASKPVTALNMNYASAVLGAVLIFAGIDWMFRGRRHYVGAMMRE
ncbi:hypothetical protein H2204_002333 [Knufia peltigerae]|uniref:Amino acid transporter n=1 Tax=Knufia peltigerae TaxID=1002370 RepID=A0AA39D2M7_9EURO|nr:hypothetical protein H2204_002333 [Knufia peltigerae]